MTIMVLVAWVITYPEAALYLVSSIRRKFRRTVIQRYGNQIFQELAAQLKAEARRMEFPEAIAEELIEENQQEIIERLGNQYARDLLDD